MPTRNKVQRLSRDVVVPEGYVLVPNAKEIADGDLVYGEFYLPGLPAAFGWCACQQVKDIDMGEALIARRTESAKNAMYRKKEQYRLEEIRPCYTVSNT